MTDPIIRANGDTITRAALRDRVAHVAGGLARAGIAPGDRVALIARNGIEFVEITLAAGVVGAFAVPINWHLTAAEVGELLDDCAPAILFADDDLAASIPPAWAGRVIAIGPDYAKWRDGSPPYAGDPRPAPGSIVYTSGTTGRPKGVRRATPTPEQAERMRAIRADLYRIDGESRVAIPGPLYHSFPSQFAAHAALHAAYTEILPRFDAEALLALIERERITSVAMAPIMFVRLLRLPAEIRARYDLSSLRWAIHAGGPCADDVKRAMIQWWGPVLAEYYGGTECGPLTLCTSAEWVARPGTCGRPLEDVELRIVDAAGQDVPQGTPGEIFGRLWAYPDFTYHNDPAKRTEVALGQLVTMGDVGYQDADGYLYLCDRARDMVVSGGVNIYPAEIEKALIGLPGVADCAVFGVPDAEYGEALVAYVAGDALSAEGIQAGLRGLIAGYKVPRTIVIVPALERDPAGKVRKQVLRQRHLDRSAETG